MRGCQFVRPAAALWCLIAPLVARRHVSAIQVLAPRASEPLLYLSGIGLFDQLRRGGIKVEGDQEVLGDYGEHPQLVLPLLGFATPDDVEQLTNTLHMTLHGSGLGAPNMYPVAVETFSELAANAVQHAESPVGAYGFVQFFRFAAGPRFVCGVGDGGIGIRGSLEKNPEFAARMTSDIDAVALAVQERVSGTGEPLRGIGLYQITEYMRARGRQLIIHSGTGLLELRDGDDRGVRRSPIFPGTMAYASIAT